MSLNWKSALDTRNTTLDRKGGRERVRYAEKAQSVKCTFRHKSLVFQAGQTWSFLPYIEDNMQLINTAKKTSLVAVLEQANNVKVNTYLPQR